MSFAAKHNHPGVKFTFNIPKSHSYKKLSDLASEYGFEHVHTVRGAFVKDGIYGEQATLVTDHELVNMPSFMLKTIKEILADGESISIINNGNAGFTVYDYTNSYGLQYGLNFVDK